MSAGYGEDAEPRDAARIRPYLRTPPQHQDGPGTARHASRAEPPAPTAGPWTGSGDEVAGVRGWEPSVGARGWTEPAEAHPEGLRPFILTSGRVDGVDPAIGLETQVTVRPPSAAHERRSVAALSPELQAIISLCRDPVSVAEISARLRLHLGVVRILVGDLRVAGYLDVHARDIAAPHDPDTILRVIRGLRAIS
jgi:hypothetical protein